MKHKTISTQSSKLLSFFHERELLYFDIQQAIAVLTHSKENAVRELLSDMVRRGLLLRIKDGLYFIIPYEQPAESFMPDWHLVAEALMQSKEHYIGYYSALQIHNLITQPSLKEQIVVSKQMRPSEHVIKNVVFQYIYHNEQHYFGTQKIWIDSFNKVNCSDLEKTIVDCLFKPHYAGGIVEIAKAIYQSKDQIKYDQLYDYVRQFGSQAVVKRLGFLLEMLEIKHTIVNQLQGIKTNSYILLDTELPKTGKLISRWSIQQNMDIETIKSSIYT